MFQPEAQKTNIYNETANLETSTNDILQAMVNTSVSPPRWFKNKKKLNNFLLYVFF